MHVPPPQVSVPLQKAPSSHGAVLLACVQRPIATLQLSVVQGLPSPHSLATVHSTQRSPDSMHIVRGGVVHGLPGLMQAPPEQRSIPVQKAPSGQGSPSVGRMHGIVSVRGLDAQSESAQSGVRHTREIGAAVVAHVLA
jgi:hypothetical protein